MRLPRFFFFFQLRKKKKVFVFCFPHPWFIINVFIKEGYNVSIDFLDDLHGSLEISFLAIKLINEGERQTMNFDGCSRRVRYE